MIEETIKTIDDVMEQVASTPTEENVTMCFTQSELDDIAKKFMTLKNPMTSLCGIMDTVFNRMGVRYMGEIDCSTLDESKRYRQIIDEVELVASLCIVKEVAKKKIVKHKKGDFKRDNKGNPIMKSDGSGYETYQTNETDTIDTIEYKPYWDYRNSSLEEARLSKLIENYIAPFDKTRVVSKLSSSIDVEFTKNRIKDILKYFKFEDEEFFVESFTLFMSNLKSRTCGNEPLYPMMFSIYSTQGMGKTWFVDILREVVDELFETHCMTSSFDKAFGRFNSVLMTRGLVTFSEAKGLTKADRDAFKRATTDNTIEIEMKGRDSKTVKNMATFLCVSNEPVLPQLTGMEMNRRIIEFNMIDRTRDANGDITRISKDELKSIFTDILTSVPFEYDHKKVIEHIGDESRQLLNFNMEQVVSDILRSDKVLQAQISLNDMSISKNINYGDTELLSKRKQLRMIPFKQKCMERKVPVNFVLSWMNDNGLIVKNNNNYCWFIDVTQLPHYMSI